MLPNSTAWTFEFDGEANLDAIVTPTGATVSYTRAIQGPFGTPPNQIYNEVIASRTVNANDGTGPHTWTYSGYPTTATGSVTVTDPDGDQTVHSLTPFGGSYPAPATYYETSVQYNRNIGGTQTLLKTVATNYSTPTCVFFGSQTTSICLNLVPTSVTTTWPNARVSETVKSYDAGISGNSNGPILLGQVLQENDYDYGNGSPGALLRQTVTT